MSCALMMTELAADGREALPRKQRGRCRSSLRRCPWNITRQKACLPLFTRPPPVPVFFASFLILITAIHSELASFFLFRHVLEARKEVPQALVELALYGRCRPGPLDDPDAR